MQPRDFFSPATAPLHGADSVPSRRGLGNSDDSGEFGDSGEYSDFGESSDSCETGDSS